MRFAIACLFLLAALGACTPKQPQTNAPTPVSVTERVAKLDVPESFAPFHMEFVDARHGYAMFAKFAEKRAEVVLFRTIDGGLNWIRLNHPEPVAENQQMYPADPDTIVLLSEPSAWNVSKDGGATWKRSPYTADGVMPPEYPRALDRGPFYLDRGPHYEGPTLIRDVGDPGFSSPVPAGYENASLTNESRDRRIWLATVKDGQAATTVSPRGTRAFAEVAVPRQAGRPLFMARVVVSQDGEDVWLLGDQEDPSASGGGKSVMRGSVLKSTGLPLVWKLENNAWVPKPIRGIEEKPGWPYPVVPVGGGALMLAAPGLTGYVTDVFRQVPGTPNLDYVSLLRDGTVHGGINQAGVLYLSEGRDAERTWIKIEVLAQAS
jgi:hypothetical protein